jgi:hypothetical protein
MLQPGVGELFGVPKEWLSQLCSRETWHSMSQGLKRLTELLQARMNTRAAC